MFLNIGINIRKGADRAGNGAGGNIFPRINKTLPIAIEFRIGLRHLEAKSHRFRMDTVGAADANVILMGIGLRLQRGQQRIHIGEQDIASLRQLHRQASIQHIRRCHALMYKARLIANIFGQVGEKGDHVMLCFAFNLVNAVNIEITTLPHRLGGSLGNNAQLRLRITGMGFNLEPDTEFALRVPDGGHLGAGITGDHGGYLSDYNNGRRLT